MHIHRERVDPAAQARSLRRQLEELKQGSYESLASYYRRFESTLETANGMRVSLSEVLTVEKVALRNGRNLEEATPEDRNEANRRAEAMLFINIAHRRSKTTAKS
jgi:hypothetical protein